MAHRFIFGLLFFLTIGCSINNKVDDSLLDYIPENTGIIIKTTDLNNLTNSLNNNELIASFEGSSIYEEIKKELEALSSLNLNEEAIISISQLGPTNHEFTFVTEFNENLFKKDSLKPLDKSSFTYENQTLYKYQKDSLSFYGTSMNGKLILSSSKTILENTIKYHGKIEHSTELKKLYNIAKSDNLGTVLIDLKKSKKLSSNVLLNEESTPMARFANWVSLDIDVLDNHIHLNGVTIATDSSYQYLNLLKGTHSLHNATPSIAPRNANAILSLTFDDFSVFNTNRLNLVKEDSAQDSLMKTVEEIGFIFKNEQTAIVLNTIGISSLAQYIENSAIADSDYQGNQIFELKNSDFLNNRFNPIVSNYRGKYCTIIENAFLFSSELSFLQSIIRNKKNNTTFDQTDVYNSAQDVLANESSILFVADETGLKHNLKEVLSSVLFKDFQKQNHKNKTFAAQIIMDDGFAHLNMVAKRTGRKKKINSVSPLFTVQLEENLATKPQFVLNHRTNRKEIVVQDVLNNLYLISSDGKIIWKKELDGQIQGKIHQVDLYKNRRLQLAFTTNNQFLILDRNGKEVAPFEKKFDSGNLNELAVFDYDNNKNYRFVVTQGTKTFMYNGKGSIVKGFTYTDAENPILRAPKHIRVGKKDYLIFLLENGSLKILNRIGNVRTKVSDNIDFSNNDLYLYKNKFIITDKKGRLYQISTSGKTLTTELRLNEDHGLDATSKTLVHMNDNILSIKGKKVELEFGVYSHPKIFYIYDKIYVSVTDIQNQRVYLFDSQANSISNFPVFGSSLIDLTDMENDRKLEVVTQDQKNSIIVYQLN